MGIFLVYIIKSSFYLVLFYFFYKLLLSKETFHRFNRFALLTIIGLSIIVPFSQIIINNPVEAQKVFTDIQEVAAITTVTDIEAFKVSTYQWVNILVLVYGIGFLFFLGRNIYSVFRILLLLSKNQTSYVRNKYRLILHECAIAPFSWMNFIIISKNDFEEAGDKILIHEMAHIGKRHSLDLILAELSVLFHWFNPAVWLIKQELHTVHEYQADESVLQQGIDAKQYQLLLIKKAVGTVRFNSLANSFNHSKLKKRITMMLRKKSSPWARLKFLYVIPITGIAMTVFAHPEISGKLDEISEVKVSDLSSIIKNKEKIAGEKDSLKDEKIVNLTVIGDSLFDRGELMRDSEGSLIKKVQVEVDVDGEIVDLTMFVTADTENFQSEEMTILGQKVDVNLSLRKEAPLYIVDGKEVDQSVFNDLKADAIERIDVLKDEDATKFYGAKGKNGIVVVTLRK